MKKIKFFLLAAVAVLSFASCSKDDEPVVNNITSEYKLNDDMVAAQKAKSKKDEAVLLVAFGSTWSNAFQAFDATKAAYEKAFPNADVYVSFSSDICINRASAGENGEKRDYYEPRYLLHAIGAAKYSKVYVQSLQVIPGEEFANVVACVKKFMNNGYIASAHLDDAYLKKLDEDKAIFLGLPLLNDPDKDVPTVAKELDKEFGAEAKKGVFAFMGHGNPDSYDTFKANIRYNQLEEALQKLNPNYYVGCVDQPENFKPWVRKRMEANGIKGGDMYLFPLMSIAGDHAHNDMAGDDDAWDEDEEAYEENEEGEVEDTSWRMYFGHFGFNVPAENCHLKGLLELPGVLQVWINHTKNAQFLEDAYHTMNIPED